MMKFMSHSVKSVLESRRPATSSAIRYDSMFWVDAKSTPGVRFAIHRVSFGRRMDLSRRVRELSRKAEFLEAGNELGEKIEANILAQEIDAMYLRWGLVSVEGLLLDGELATADSLIERGPEDFVREIVGAIKAQCGLTEDERKN